MRILATIVLLALAAPLSAQRDQIAGIWIGTFNGQPLQGKTKGGYPETITRFEMRLSAADTKITGFFTNLDKTPLTSRRITTGKKWEAGVWSFEVLDSDQICTWSVRVQGDRLWGTRNSGRMSSIGLGSGARLFGVRANRQPEEKWLRLGEANSGSATWIPAFAGMTASGQTRANHETTQEIDTP